jgi:hypothetical protein
VIPKSVAAGARPARAPAARRWAALAGLVCLALLGCARPAPRADTRPEIATGSCDLCAMPIEDARFACERRAEEGWRVYDSIECLIRDGGTAAAFGSWLADHATGTLHRSDSLWVVRGKFASPMAGGLAAFLSRAQAESLAASSAGTVARLAEIAAAPVH